MLNETLENLTMAKVSKEATRDGLRNHAARLAKQLETTLHQIDALNLELDAIDELQIESSNDPETQDPTHTLQPLSKLDLEPANHPEDP